MNYLKKIETFEDFNKYLQEQAEEYEENYDEELCDSCDIEEHGLNEYIGGKAEVFKEVLEVWNKIMNKNK